MLYYPWGDDGRSLSIFFIEYILIEVYNRPVLLVDIHKCLSDETRLRILHLLACGPLCVCHFQSILDAPQVKVSKHLAYLREHGLVEAARDGAWMIYSLPRKMSPELKANLQCLRECCRKNPVYRADLVRMEAAVCRTGGPLADCCKTTKKRKPQVS